jgi:hypothetical protein
MDPDLFLVIGVVLLVFSLPAIVSAISDGRAPRAASVALVIGGGLLVLAINSKPNGYTINEVPDVFVRVIGGFIN